ncbi:hypothetical protein GCM10029964_004720 [Kibdelosporangium lantanae]
MGGPDQVTVLGSSTWDSPVLSYGNAPTAIPPCSARASLTCADSATVSFSERTARGSPANRECSGEAKKKEPDR